MFFSKHYKVELGKVPLCFTTSCTTSWVLCSDWVIAWVKLWLRKFRINSLRSFTCPFTSFFWLLSHVIYLKLARVIQECLLSQSCVMGSRTVNHTIKKTIWHLAIWQNWCFGQFYHARLKSKHFSQFFWWEVNLRGLRAFILQNVQGSVVETEKKVLQPITQLGKEETLIILLPAWDRSRDSTAKRNLSKDM